MKIGALAEAAATSIETIRYYERAGLLPAAARSEANYRVYGPGHVERLSFIRHCRSLDMALDEIRILLQFRDVPDADCGRVNQLLDDHIGHVAERMRELQALETQLRALRARCRDNLDSDGCGILKQLSAAPSKRPPRQKSRHVPGSHR